MLEQGTERVPLIKLLEESVSGVPRFVRGSVDSWCLLQNRDGSWVLEDLQDTLLTLIQSLSFCAWC